uniref:Transmembrane protein n=2 Tax=Globodera rostochiensis TaxID=31243 RepID=A0A914IAE8_GLORO
MGKVPPFVVGWLSATLSSRLTSETTEKKQPIVVACSRRKNSDQNRYGLVVVVVSWVYLYFSIVPFWSNVESRLIPPNTKGLSAASKCVRGDDCEHSKSAAQHNQMAKKIKEEGSMSEGRYDHEKKNAKNGHEDPPQTAQAVPGAMAGGAYNTTRVACHELGHSALLWHQEHAGAFDEVTKTRAEMRASLAVDLGGRCAEEHFFGVSIGHVSDQTCWEKMAMKLAKATARDGPPRRSDPRTAPPAATTIRCRSPRAGNGDHRREFGCHRTNGPLPFQKEDDSPRGVQEIDWHCAEK